MAIHNRLQVLVILHSAIVCSSAEYKAYGSMHNRALQHVYNSTIVMSAIDCSRACSLDKSCVAANYERSTGKCGLNDMHPFMNGTVIQTASYPPSDVLFLTAGCRAPWSSFRGHCYLYNPAPLSWSAAEAHCVSLGGHLADIHDDEENQFVAQFVTNWMWFGMTDIWNGKPRLWVTGAAVNYDNFNVGEPNNYGDNEHCVEMWTDKMWNDYECSYAEESLCKKPCYM